MGVCCTAYFLPPFPSSAGKYKAQRASLVESVTDIDRSDASIRDLV